MNLWIDTEFNDFGGSLISMALVDEDGLTWYEALPCLAPTEWVRRNVLPVMGNKQLMSRRLMQRSLYGFLTQYDAIHVVADWPEDIAHFCQLLITGSGTRMDGPPLTMEIRRDLHTNGSRIPHNALEDVLSMRAMDLASPFAKTCKD